MWYHMSMNELKEIPNTFGKYMCNVSGDIFSNLSNKFLSQCNKPAGYKFVLICLDGKIKNKTVHRLVAETWIPNPNNYKEINHKNGIKHDNRTENLEWCTHKYNVNHAIDVLKVKNRRIKKAKIRATADPNKDCTFLCNRFSDIEKEEIVSMYFSNSTSLRKLGKLFNVSRTTVQQIIREVI